MEKNLYFIFVVSYSAYKTSKFDACGVCTEVIVLRNFSGSGSIHKLAANYTYCICIY